jgi:hypothetical protein
MTNHAPISPGCSKTHTTNWSCWYFQMRFILSALSHIVLFSNIVVVAYSDKFDSQTQNSELHKTGKSLFLIFMEFPKRYLQPPLTHRYISYIISDCYALDDIRYLISIDSLDEYFINS